MKELIIKTILEGLGLGALLVLVCAVGIRKGAVGMVHLYSVKVQERCVNKGLTTHKKIMWCDDDAIKPYFIAAGKAIKYGNLRRQLSDSLEDKPFPTLPETVQKNTYFEFGSVEEHFKYRDAVMKAYPKGNYPIFEGCNHMQYQFKDPQGFAEMLRSITESNTLPNMPFLKP